MKKILVFTISVFLAVFSATAQSIEDFITQQKGKDKVEYVKLPSEAIKTMQLASKFVSWVKTFDSDFSKEDAQILELVSNIIDDVEEIEILTSTDKNLDLHKEFKNSKLLKNNKYRLLKKKEEKGNMLLVYAQKGKVIENLVFIEKNLKNNKKTIIANVKGEVKLEKIADIIDLVEKQK